jgi:hypothetical protein
MLLSFREDVRFCLLVRTYAETPNVRYCLLCGHTVVPHRMSTDRKYDHTL